MARAFGWLDAVQRFIVGGGFPVFVLSLLLIYEVLLAALLLVPPGDAGMGAFAEEFRVWCLGYDPATGKAQWAYALAMTVPPLLIGATVALLWWGPLRAVLARPRQVARHAGAAVVLMAGAAGGLALLGSAPPSGELPFPAEALRTAQRAPALALTNQLGQPIDLVALRGRVVLLTAIYASCPHSCPVLLTQSKQAVAEFSAEEQEGLRVVAVTLDPQHDTPDVLADLSEMHGLPAPLFNLVTGESAEVERVLDEMGIARERDPETGLIGHSSLFLLIDREGKVAYRFGLGVRQQRWLVTALGILLRETPAAG
jgi:protein SCO1/2